jgi:hypothetical protein
MKDSTVFHLKKNEKKNNESQNNKQQRNHDREKDWND